jgi:hypothetical protein
MDEDDAVVVGKGAGKQKEKSDRVSPQDVDGFGSSVSSAPTTPTPFSLPTTLPRPSTSLDQKPSSVTSKTRSLKCLVTRISTWSPP